MGNEKVSNPVQPFFHLENEGFWHLQPIPGKEDILEAIPRIRTVSELQSLVLGARLDDALFIEAQDADNRQRLRTVLIENL
jgi:putative restriction endonuclease